MRRPGRQPLSRKRAVQYLEIRGRHTVRHPDPRWAQKGTEIPYIGHQRGVAALVIDAGGDEDLAIAALLHDAVEDQGGSSRLADIRARFGCRVAAIVDGCTDADTIPKPEWVERKRRYIKSLSEKSGDIWQVAVADKLHNARSIPADFAREGDAVFERFNARRTGRSGTTPASPTSFRPSTRGASRTSCSRRSRS
jgi:(p)ppGpp synthase/HD superfamily hydrolase